MRAPQRKVARVAATRGLGSEKKTSEEGTEGVGRFDGGRSGESERSARPRASEKRAIAAATTAQSKIARRSLAAKYGL